MKDSIETMLEQVNRAFEEDKEAHIEKKITLEERVDALELSLLKLMDHVQNLYKHFLGR